MQVTSIKKERKRLSSVIVDGEFWDKIDDDILLQKGIKVGTLVDKNFLSNIKLLSDCKRAKDKALYLLSFRNYSKKELTDKLKKDYCEQSVKETVLRMEELGLINDIDFAKRYAKELLINKHFSKRRVEIELLQKGIEKDVAYGVLQNFDCDEVDQIKFLINKKYKLACSDEKVKKRAIAFLQRYGYSWDDIRQFFDSCS